MFDDAKWRYPSEGSHEAGLLRQGRSVSWTQASLGELPIPLLSTALGAGFKLSSPGRAFCSASSDFNKEQRSYLKKSVNTWFGFMCAYVLYFLKAGFVCRY